jgi:hypothetical protein
MESVITYVPLPKPVALGSVMVVEGRRPVRVVKDSIFGELVVYEQDTAGRRFWWIKEPVQLDKLITGWKTGLKAKRALDYAGLTDEHWESILRAMPDIRRVKQLCLASPSFGAMNTVQSGLQNDPRLAYTFLKDRGDLHTEVEKVGDEQPLQPTVNVAVQVNNIEHERKIEERSRERLARRLSERSGGGEARGHEALAGVVQG